MDEVNISTFKATCLKLLRRVKETGLPLRVTLRGEPIAEVIPPRSKPAGRSWLGSARGTGEITGDIVTPTGESWQAQG